MLEKNFSYLDLKSLLTVSYLLILHGFSVCELLIFTTTLFHFHLKNFFDSILLFSIIGCYFHTNFLVAVDDAAAATNDEDDDENGDEVFSD